MPFNIAITGGHCTGKSVLAAMLFARLRVRDYDFDLIEEEARSLKREWINCRSPFDRFYLWRQQNRQEERSTARDGFITDTPLFVFYAQAVQYAQEDRDQLAVRELFRMCMEVKNRYQLIVMAKDPCEFPYKEDGARQGGSRDKSIIRHQLIQSYVEHFFRNQLFLVQGNVEERTAQVLDKLALLGIILGK